MTNWFADKQETIDKTVNAIMGELDHLILFDIDEPITGNYWIDNTHNIFAFNDGNSKEDEWIELHYELYDSFSGDIIGDIAVLCTEDRSIESLRQRVTDIVKMYYEE